MSNANIEFVGSIPENYDTYLGPLLFEFSAQDLAKRIKQIVPTDAKILEVASGTGISAQYLLQALPETAHLHATDIKEPMLEIAKVKLAGRPNITFEVADALSLPCEDEGFDAVVCQFGIMFFPDKAQGLAEMVRVLKPGGVVGLNVWDSFENNRVAGISYETIAGFFESDPPQFMKIPFGFHDIEQIKSLMESAGLQDIEVYTVQETVEGMSPMDIAKGFVTGNPSIVEIDERATVDAEEIIQAVAKAIEEEYGPEPQVPLQEIVFMGKKNG